MRCRRKKCYYTATRVSSSRCVLRRHGVFSLTGNQRVLRPLMQSPLSTLHKISIFYHEAMRLMSKWIPEHHNWVPKEITGPIRVIKSQTATREESGMHVILHAKAMSCIGQPESRLIYEKTCRYFRLHFFIFLLSELHHATSAVGTFLYP